MAVFDWIVVGSYLALMLILAYYLGRTQGSRKDYFLGGQTLPSWALATSIIATQCSTNSLLGAPAFVGFAAGGGMIWLQYELAVPVAMLLLCFLFVPIHRSKSISIYAFLEERLGTPSRLLASGSFLFFRGVATGVTVYGVASVIQLIADISYLQAVLLLMAVTIVYDLMGGMKAVVISDVIQMALLLGAILLAGFWLLEPFQAHYSQLTDRTASLVNDWGTSGNAYGFWPMLLGGIFLYMAYYGCDQSQAQRLLSAKSLKATHRVLLFNGLFRFPLVLSYCLLGLGLAAYAMDHSGFLAELPANSRGEPNINLVFPQFVMKEFPTGLVGLVIVGIFAAAMSSIDSALNSLSASTVEDYLMRWRRLTEKQLFVAAKLATLFWGVFAVFFSFFVETIAPTVLEAINKIGSMINGPLLALFAIAAFMPAAGQTAAIAGFISGLLANYLCWLLLPGVSWLWWNLLGFLVAFGMAFFVADKRAIVSSIIEISTHVDRAVLVKLGAAFAAILAVTGIINLI